MKFNKQLSDKANEIWMTIPKDRPIGNKALMLKLKLNPEDYFKFRLELLDPNHPLIATRRGKGGSVIRLAVEGEETPPLGAEKTKESHLYKPFYESLRVWAEVSEGYKQYVIERTAFGGAAKNGEWSRPDFSLVAVERYPFLFGRHIDIHTFELKTKSGWGVSSVYEALSHVSVANYSYLVIEGERDTHMDEKGEELERVEEACIQHGIGLIYFLPNSNRLLNPDIDARRNDPHPSDLNYFIETFLRNPESKDKIRNWVSL